MHRYLQFSNVGHSKFSGRKLLHPEIVSISDIKTVAKDEAKKHLTPCGIACVYYRDTNKGTIFAGQQLVGEFSIVEIEYEPTNKSTNKP